MAGTRWFRMDLSYFQNPKVAPLVPRHRAAVLLHLAMIAYCGQELTDGYVPRPVWAQLGAQVGLDRQARTAAAVTVLADAGLVDMVSGGCVVHDFLAMNPQLSRAKVEADRAKYREGKRRAREAMSTEDIVSDDNVVPLVYTTRHEMHVHAQHEPLWVSPEAAPWTGLFGTGDEQG